ncbi:MAG TPA: DUF5666 domain-containing protein [Steroidobacteraceae bacterium]|nr:DUF5666 domain-containing protein [Steroidobacteraceae bacterium]
MKTWNQTRRLLAIAALLLLGACSGSGGMDSTTNSVTTSQPIVAMGTISGFGSVFVNGVEFSTASANITIDGRRGSESELRVGQVVRVSGRIDADGRHGTATSIDFDDAVEGPVASIDAAAGTLVVLGQTVKVDATTSFDDNLQPASLAGIAVGMVIEVSGMRDAQGVIHATRIEAKAANAQVEVTGEVANLDEAAKRFDIGTLTVDYSAAQLDDLPGGVPANGLTVEAKGTLDANGVLLATRIEGKQQDMPGDDDDQAKLEGLITRFVSATDFDVNGQAVTTSANTEFERGTSADLALNVRVEVEGELLNGVVQATKVEFENEADVRLSGQVASVDATAGTFMVMGISVQTNAQTRFEDKTDARLRPFNVGSLQVGDFVEVRGSAGTGNGILAQRVEREDADQRNDQVRVRLRGVAADVAQPQFTILGVTVLTNADTEFENEAEASIDAATFFAQAAGRSVQADGTFDGTTLVAHEVELEGEDEMDD